MDHKFKVGDKVKVLDGENIDRYTAGWSSFMRDYIGKTLIVTGLTERNEKPAYCLSNNVCIWDERGLSLVESSSLITKVIFNPPATIVIWDDNTKTVVTCQPGDTYSKELGLAMCISKKYLGNKGNFNETFKKWIPEVESDNLINPEVFSNVGETLRKGLYNLGKSLTETYKNKED